MRQSRPVWLVIVLILMLLVVSGCGNRSVSNSSGSTTGTTHDLPAKVKIGYHAHLATFIVARDQKFFEEEFGKDGVQVEMVKLEHAGPLIDALKAGEIDMSSSVPSFIVAGLASGADLVVLGTTEASEQSNAVIVPADSPVKTVSDLKGKNVAVVSGSNSHLMLESALAEAGLDPEDIHLVPLEPTEARAAFASGAIDAWAIWSPFRDAAELDGARTLFENGKYLVLTDHPVVRSDFHSKYPQLSERFLAALKRTDDWINANPAEAQRLWSEENGLDTKVGELAWQRRIFIFRPVDDSDLDVFEKVVDFYINKGIIGDRLDFRSKIDNSSIEKVIK